MEIIALSGYARSGKDEAAKVLIDKYGFIRVGFADKLREVLYELNPWVSGGWDSRFNATEYDYLQNVIDRFGWDGYKASPYGTEIRRLLQRLGTEAGRQTLWDSIWIDAAFAGLPEDAKVVITDVRFENEAQAVKERGGEIWRVMRAGVGPINNHISETGLDNWDFDAYVHNDGTLEDHYKSVERRYLERVGNASRT